MSRAPRLAAGQGQRAAIYETITYDERRQNVFGPLMSLNLPSVIGEPVGCLGLIQPSPRTIRS